jgi:hypothetical protein
MDAIVMRPNRTTEQVSVRQVAGHFVMGASLGTGGALILMVSNAGAIRDLLTGGGAMPAAVFVAVCACTVAIGATLTGVIFSALDEQ